MVSPQCSAVVGAEGTRVCHATGAADRHVGGAALSPLPPSLAEARLPKGCRHTMPLLLPLPVPSLRCGTIICSGGTGAAAAAAGSSAAACGCWDDCPCCCTAIAARTCCSMYCRASCRQSKGHAGRQAGRQHEALQWHGCVAGSVVSTCTQARKFEAVRLPASV